VMREIKKGAECGSARCPMTCRKCFLMMMRQRCGVSIKDHVVASPRDFFSPHRCAGGMWEHFHLCEYTHAAWNQRETPGLLCGKLRIIFVMTQKSGVLQKLWFIVRIGKQTCSKSQS